MSKKAIVTVRPGESTIQIERRFAAPRDTVFHALTTKEIVEKWWLGPGNNIRVDELDLRVGGRWKYVQMHEGQEFQFYGVYHEVTVPERVVLTFEFSGLPERGHVSLEKMQLEDMGDGTTKMTVVSSFFSVTERDGMLASGMENGLQMTYDALDKVLAQS